jgi:molybdenum cofactor cytidylyltransferase
MNRPTRFANGGPIPGPSRHVMALVLAAGQGRRMGQPKQLMPYKDGTVVDAVLAAVTESSVDALVVVANPVVARYLTGRMPDEGSALAVNRDPASEMLVSVQLGAQTIMESFGPSPHDGIMVLLADQPQVTGGLITTCAEAFRLPKNPPGILVATYKGRRAHPAIFRVDLMNEILGWSNDRRLNELSTLYPDRVRELPITTVPMPIDVDTPADYLRLKDSD